LEKKDGKNPILSYLVNSKADIICLQEYNAAKMVSVFLIIISVLY
jgi:exonuclease III